MRWLARIGVLYPASGLADYELNLLAPQGVTFHVTRLSMPQATKQALLDLACEAERAVKLLCEARVNLVAFNCTLGSLLGGEGYDKKLINRLQELSGLPVTTTATACVEALRFLGARHLVLITPYISDMNLAEIEFLEKMGFEVISSKGYGLIDPMSQAAVPPRVWYRRVLRSASALADAYFLSCSGIRVAEIIQPLEQSLGKPVVTSQQALVWHCLRLLNLSVIKRGYGCLLEDCVKP